jgi:archaeal type IV pilus assembly protein PilA
LAQFFRSGNCEYFPGSLFFCERLRVRLSQTRDFKNNTLNIKKQNKDITHCHAHRGHSSQVLEDMKFTQNEDAVSPVIGVILMVAITVILAAVIAAFVFGMAGNISKTKVVAATAQQAGNTIIVTYQGGQDNQDVAAILGEVDGHAMTPNSVTGVGKTMSYGGSSGKDHVVVTARFHDGSTQVITDTYV